MDDFQASLSFKEALQLFLFLEPREAELPGGGARLHALLRDFLYDRLSIEEMESPESLLAKLEGGRP